MKNTNTLYEMQKH